MIVYPSFIGKNIHESSKEKLCLSTEMKSIIFNQEI